MNFVEKKRIIRNAKGTAYFVVCLFPFATNELRFFGAKIKRKSVKFFSTTYILVSRRWRNEQPRTTNAQRNTRKQGTAPPKCAARGGGLLVCRNTFNNSNNKERTKTKNKKTNKQQQNNTTNKTTHSNQQHTATNKHNTTTTTNKKQPRLYSTYNRGCFTSYRENAF